VAAALVSVSGCSVLDRNGDGNENETDNGTGNGNNESVVNPQIRNSYDFDVTLEYDGTTYQKSQDRKQQESTPYSLTVTASGFVDADEENMYYEWEYETDDELGRNGEYYFDSGSEWGRTEGNAGWLSDPFGSRGVFSDVHLGAYRLYNQNEDATSEFSVDETGMMTLDAEIQDLFFYDPVLTFIASELPPTEVQVEYEFNEESGYLTTSTISLDSVTHATEDYTLTLENLVETTNYSKLSDYEPPDIPENSS